MASLIYTDGTALATRMGATTDSVMNAVATATNDMIEGYIGAPVGPAGTAARTYDGDGRKTLRIPQGINSITLLETASSTGASFATVAATEYVLRPHDHERRSGWPAFEIRFTPSGASIFPYGFDTVRVTPGTATTAQWGWPAIPGELSQLAIVLGTRMWQARQSGETLVIGSNDYGQAIARFLPEPEYRKLLDRYRFTVEGSYIR